MVYHWDFYFLQRYIPLLWKGVLVTLAYTVGTIFLGLLIGLLVGLGRLSRSKLLARVATLYVTFFRSVPILLGLGCAVGAFSGLLIVFLRVQPVVVTLAMYFILQGVDLVLSPQPQALPGHGGWTTHLAGSIA